MLVCFSLILKRLFMYTNKPRPKQSDYLCVHVHALSMEFTMFKSSMKT